MARNPFERFLVAGRGGLLGMKARNVFSILRAKFQKKRGPSRLQTDAARRQGRGGGLISPRHRTRSNREHGDRAAPARRECEDRECGRSPSGRSFAATFLPAAPVRALREERLGRVARLNLDQLSWTGHALKLVE